MSALPEFPADTTAMYAKYRPYVRFLTAKLSRQFHIYTALEDLNQDVWCHLLRRDIRGSFERGYQGALDPYAVHGLFKAYLKQSLIRYLYNYRRDWLRTPEPSQCPLMDSYAPCTLPRMESTMDFSADLESLWQLSQTGYTSDQIAVLLQRQGKRLPDGQPYTSRAVLRLLDTHMASLEDQEQVKVSCRA